MNSYQSVIYYGTEEVVSPTFTLKAGSVDLIYEGGFIRYIKLGDKEIIRMINHAVRDHNWGTVPLRIFDETIENNKDSFIIRYKAEAKQGNIHFLWKCKIEGDSDNTVSFTIDGEALTDFQRNRIGFTVLHPVKECEGQKVTITNSGGDSEVKEFPKLISPHQPFFDIVSMRWDIGNTKVSLEFSGDTFETEDQRNWTDASYKTYCTPLALPFPVLLKKGSRVKQVIKLKVEGEAEQNYSQKTVHTFSISNDPYPLLKINIGQSTEVKTLSEHEITTIKTVGFDYYQVDIKLYETGWKDKFARAVIESDSLGIPLELSLFFDDAANEAEELADFVANEPLSVAVVNTFNRKPHVTQENTLEAVLPVLRRLFPKALIGAGTNAFFAELNRDRISTKKIDFLVYSVNPQVHAFDNNSLIETIDAQPYTVRTAKSFSDDKPVHISPVTFKMRWNPNATGEDVVIPGQLPDDVDVRQPSLFGAAWLLGTVNSLLKAGTASVTFFETVGLKGIMQSGTPLFKDKFHAGAGTVYPVYFIFKILMDHKDWHFYTVETNSPMTFTGVVFENMDNGRKSALLANYQPVEITVSLPEIFHNSEMIVVDENNIRQLMDDPALFDKLEKKSVSDTVKVPPLGFICLV